MKPSLWVLAFIAACSGMALPSAALTSFQDLDFESATVAVIPTNQFGGPVPFSDAFPGWTGYGGTNQFALALQDSYTLGAYNISILGPDWSYYSFSPPIINGHFTALLQAGADFHVTGTYPVALAQTGSVPLDAKSIQMKVDGFNAGFTVSLGGQNIPMFAIGSGTNYTLVTGDISAYAGQTTELRITVSPLPNNLFNSVGLDDIAFSPEVIPEPNTFIVLVAGFLFLLSAHLGEVRRHSASTQNQLSSPR